MLRVKIAKPGKSVWSTDPRDFSVDTDFEAIMRLQDAGHGTVAINPVFGSTTTVTIPHGLGYPPFFQVFLVWHGFGDTDFEPSTKYAIDPFSGAIDYQPKVTSANLLLRFINSAGVGGTTVDYYYFIGRDPLT